MRAAAITLAVVIAVLLVRDLYVMRTAWSVSLATLVAGGIVVTAAFGLRNAPHASRRARRALPVDRGMPKPPPGAPYRGTY